MHVTDSISGRKSSCKVYLNGEDLPAVRLDHLVPDLSLADLQVGDLFRSMRILRACVLNATRSKEISGGCELSGIRDRLPRVEDHLPDRPGSFCRRAFRHLSR